MSFIPESDLGRYEFIDPSINSRKFWHIIYDMEKNQYLATWGRIGQGSPPPKVYTAKEAAKKIKEKVNKGYQKNNAPRYGKVIGNLAVNFIMSLMEDGDGEQAA